MTQFQSNAAIVDLVKTADGFVAIRKPTGKDTYVSVGLWSPYNGLVEKPAIIPQSDYMLLADACAKVYANG